MKPPTFALIAVLTAVAVAFLIVPLFFRSRKILTCHELMAHLYRYILRGQQDFLNPDDPQSQGAWRSIGGAIGLRRCQRNVGVLVKLCQLREDRHDLESGEMDEVMQLATDARLKANRALIAGLLHWGKSVSVDEAAADALRAYARLADRTHTLYALGGAPLCAMRLQELL